ncbi:Maf family protein [Thorsellia kenyensis]|uniref:Nucleoside triphosphate pyrophosphatase n=1 Tax=Thorsellia kenyensis TaxID=1549888 RepID=A0ABV6CE27_9GAMM
MFDIPYPIVLASSSKARQYLLGRLNLPFISVAPDIDESAKLNEPAEDLVTRLAQLKAAALVPRYNDHLIIASDQVCVLEGQIIGKPYTEENAFKQLKKASGKAVPFLTSIAIYHPLHKVIKTQIDNFTVHFRTLTDREIIRYIQQDSPLECAGSFKYESLGITLFEKLEGDDPNALMGLGLITLSKLLREL